MTPFRGVIFDVDGTLVDSNDAHARAWVAALAEDGISVPFERVRRLIGMGGDKLLPTLTGIAADSDQGRRIAGRRGEIFTERWLPTLRPFPRTRDLLRRIAGDGMKLAVASSAKADELDRLLEIAGADDLIKAQTSADDAERSKPDPDIVQAALERLGLSAAQAVMVGDTPYDVAAAARAGLAIIGVRCGGWEDGDLRGALAVYADPADLLDRYDESPLAATHESVRGASSSAGS